MISIVAALSISISTLVSGLPNNKALTDPCPQAPIHHPNYWDWYNWPLNQSFTCPPGSTLDNDCFTSWLNDYYQVVTWADNNYREKVCHCWDLYPTDAAKRNQCISEAETDVDNTFDAWRNIWYNAVLSTCCSGVS